MYLVRLLRSYPQLSRREILFELPCAEGWALLAGAMETDGTLNVDRMSDGYIAQEIDRRKIK